MTFVLSRVSAIAEISPHLSPHPHIPGLSSAVRAHLDLHSQGSIGMHFGLIDNAGESFEAPVNDLIAARRAHGVDETDFVAPHYGQVFRY